MIETHYRHVKEIIGTDVQLCVVSKKRSVEEIRSYYDAGERIFGENHAQELLSKVDTLPSDIRWQFIGHLQRNKVKDILPYTDCIQSLDNLRLADVIEKEAAKINKIQDVLVEFHLAQEDTNKTGLDPKDADAFLDALQTRKHIHLIGMMAMGPHTSNMERVRAVFTEAHSLYERLQKKYGEEHMHVLSLGMSADYPEAVACGSTMVRVGTYLFEESKEDQK
jgi:pyridoxal phosphate enzyme (YggS family)